jgi:hypothetical protein
MLGPRVWHALLTIRLVSLCEHEFRIPDRRTRPAILNSNHRTFLALAYAESFANPFHVTDEFGIVMHGGGARVGQVDI